MFQWLKEWLLGDASKPIWHEFKTDSSEFDPEPILDSCPEGPLGSSVKITESNRMCPRCGRDVWKEYCGDQYQDACGFQHCG